MKLYHSEIESRRLSRTVYRGLLDAIDPEWISGQIQASGIDLLIIRVPVTLAQQMHRLNDMQYEYIIADTLVYYTCDLAGCRPGVMANPDLVFTPLGKDNQVFLNPIISESFKNYCNNYHSNPLIHVDIVSAYKEWAGSFLYDEEKGSYSWIIETGQDKCAFVCCQFEQDLCEIVLNGVTPARSGRGIYGDIIRHCQSFFKKREAASLIISTQIYNYAVQKVWARNGFYLNKAYYTLHINNTARRPGPG